MKQKIPPGKRWGFLILCSFAYGFQPSMFFHLIALLYSTTCIYSGCVVTWFLSFGSSDLLGVFQGWSSASKPGTVSLLATDYTRHSCVMFQLWRSCWSLLRPLKTMLVIPLDAPQRVSEASQKPLSATFHREWSPRVFLTETTSSCTVQIEPGRKSDTGA